MSEQHELIPMATGEYLKKRRLERKLSLADAAKAVILDEKLLGEIEQDTAERIAPIYRKGYIQTYARFLGMPESEISGLLAMYEVKMPDLQHIFAEPPKRNSAEKWLRASSYVLASLLVGTLAWQFTHEAVRLSQSGARLQNKPGVDAEQTEALSSPAQQQPFSGPVSASIAPLGALHAKGAKGLDTGEQAWAALATPALPDGETRLQIAVSADSWVEITDSSGQELEMDLLRGGSEKSYHGQPPFRILLGRASAVRLSVDDEPVDLTSFTRDDVAQLSWPQKLPPVESEPDGG